MTATKQAVPRTSPGMAPTPSRQSRYIAALRRPQCTHTTMNRVHGVACTMCARVPDHGWVYQCRQDHQPHRDDALPDIDSMPAVPDDSEYCDIKARVAEHLKMSPSIVRGIRSGDYDSDQVNKLIAQREHAIQTIKAQEGGSQGSPPPTSFDSIIASAGSTYYSPQNSAVLSSSSTLTSGNDSSNVQQPSAVKCSFNICASCRPYFADRLWASFESMLAEQTPLTAADLQHLPLINPEIARTIGLRSTPNARLRSLPSHRSIDIADGEAESDISVDWSATNSGESDAGGSDSPDQSDLLPCLGPMQCPVWSRNSGCAYENGSFDDGKRAEAHGFVQSISPEHSHSRFDHYTYIAPSTPGASSATATTVSLPTTPTMPHVPLLPTEDTFDLAPKNEQEKNSKAGRLLYQTGFKRRKTEFGLREKSSKTSLDSNVDAEGGVAITY